MSGQIPSRQGAVIIGTLPPGSLICEAPDHLKERGVIFVASHPEHSPRLVTASGIYPLEFIPPGDSTD